MPRTRKQPATAIEALSTSLTEMFTPEPADSGTAAKPARESVRAKRYPSQQEPHSKRRSESLKGSEGGKQVERIKEASKGKSANKPGNPVPVAGRAAEQNGVRSPRRDGAIAQCWALFDEKPDTTSAQLPDYCAALGLNESNMRQEFYRWRRFNGLVTPRAAK